MPCAFVSMPKPPHSKYVGRFAPTPSGPLHLGSLVCAIASYLDAKAHQGQWLVRIDDIDQTRIQAGATHQILSCIREHGLVWDKSPYYQSQQQSYYQRHMALLNQRGWLYPCSCNRKRIQALKGVYDQYCLKHPDKVSPPFAWRIHWAKAEYRADLTPIRDRLQDIIPHDVNTSDTVLVRRDGLFRTTSLPV